MAESYHVQSISSNHRQISGESRRDLVAIPSRQPAMLRHNDAATAMALASRVAGQRSKHNIMNSKPPYYRIYLLTVWQERNRGPPEEIIWRFRLEDPRSGQQQAFADAATFMLALQTIAADSAETEKPAGEEEGGEA